MCLYLNDSATEVMICVSVPQKPSAGGGIYAVRLLILKLKKTLKKADERKVAAYLMSAGLFSPCFGFYRAGIRLSLVYTLTSSKKY